MPVDLVTADEFSKITAGVKDAPKVETPKPLVEKVAETKPVEEQAAKVENKEVKAAREAEPSPPEPKPVESKPEESKPVEAKPVEKTPRNSSRPRRSPIRSPRSLPRTTRRSPSRRRSRPRRRCRRGSPRRRRPSSTPRRSRRCSTSAMRRGSRPPATCSIRSASLGLPRGTAETLSMSELDALRARLANLWNIPAGAKDPRELTVLIRIKLKPDGTLNGPPMVLTSGQHSAVRRGARQRDPRGVPRPAIRHAPARALRAMERHRDYLRSARDDPRMTAAADSGDDRAMNERSFATKSLLLSRRRDACAGRRTLRPARSPVCRRARPRRVLRLDVTQGSVQPMPIALPDFIGRGTARSRRRAQHDADHHRESAALRAVRADRSGRLSRTDIEHRHRAAFPDWRTINAQALVTGRLAPDRRQADGAVPSVGRVRGPAARRQAVQHHAGQLAPHRPHHLRCDLRAAHRREGLLRQPRRVRRRIGSEGPPRQAPRAHGSGRRQRALPHARRRSRADAALLVVDAGTITYMSYGQGDPQGLPDEHRDRPARDRQQFSRHELQPAVLARRPARHLQPAAAAAIPTCS